MNKRFSTLMAAALVAGGMSASAAVTVDGAVATKLVSNPARNYMLTTTQFTSGSISNDVIGLKDGKASAASLNASAINTQLWTLKVTTVAGSNRFVLVNKVDGTTLSFDPANAVAANKSGVVTEPAAGSKAYELSGEDTEWTWVSAPNAKDELKNVTVLKNAFSKDSTMAIAKTTAGALYAYKYANDNVPTATTALTLQAVEPGTLAMTANDLNVLGEAPNKYFTFSTNKTGLIGAGEIIGKKFHAVDNATTTAVKLQNLGTDGKTVDKYAYVDTAFHVGSGPNENVWYKLANTKDAGKFDYLSDDAKEFIVERNLFKDSVIVSVKSAALKEYSETAASNGSHWQTAQSDEGDNQDGLKYYTTISAIKLTPTTEVLTLFLGDKKENLLFAVSAPEADNTLTTVADGVYTIKNNKGQYLAVPVYSAYDEFNGYPEWITVNEDEQNPAHMPAYQWVVLKDKTKGTAAETSTVTLTNREFAQKWVYTQGSPVTLADASYSAIQLRKNAGATYMYSAKVEGLWGATDSLNFKAVDKAILGDTLLGYKNMEANDLLVNRYTFNYLHPYTLEKFIAKSAKDSVLAVLDGKSNFIINTKGDIQDYGYNVKKAGTRIEGLKQLRRQAYQLIIPSTKALKFGQNGENKYVVSSADDIALATFFFKENNELKDSKDCYHAMIQLSSSTNGAGDDAIKYWDYSSKAGVSDDDLAATLKAIVISEKRTSAFNIAKNDAPLYRRFNSLELEGNAGDAPDTLRFKEKYRGEYLQVEANPNFSVKGVNFLGIYTPDFTKDGKSFIVDTAFVDRFDGNIKPQYLISINRKDNPGTPGVDCTETGKHYNFDANGNAVETDKAHCVHATPATPGFHFGDYLVNFADSVTSATGKVITKDDYNWKGYTRAGFVKAVHMGDSLYILTGQFANITNETFKAADIIKAVADKKYAAKYIVNLVDNKDDKGKSKNDADRHKLVTWSMRYVNPEKAVNEVEADRAFLMESQKASTDDLDIAPINGQWLKMQNGCIVLSGTVDGANSSFDQITQADDALIFNVAKGSKEDFATENETITASTFSVIAKQGAVEVIGAAGKNVVITNILGQVIANTVLTSDDATIAASAGVVVVAVEGEDAVKAIVK